MPKLPECNRCLYYSHDYHLICVLHPSGVEGNSCPDFIKLNPELEGKKFVDFLGIGEAPTELDTEQWEPEGASYYNEELILLPPPRWTLEQKLEYLDSHPLFTGRCPNCEMPMPFDASRVHWDCDCCGWKDDSAIAATA